MQVWKYYNWHSLFSALKIKIKKTEGQSLGLLVSPFFFSPAPALEVLRHHLSPILCIHTRYTATSPSFHLRISSLGSLSGRQEVPTDAHRGLVFFKELFAMRKESGQARESSPFSVCCFSDLTRESKEQKFQGKSLDERAKLGSKDQHQMTREMASTSPG